ncbi:ATP-binding protein [uncultured Paludibaculum sp.]|uniref:sensor histidine kinase n=1 Tax=uncultured Paludibaculum sp. TaxID=1765020 RepID=UPI002AAA821C|nr:ATP-binding protein [uncultured Paludibaculum sp.]
MILKSIRWRIQAWHGLILAGVLAGFGVPAYNQARDEQRRWIDQELNLRLDWLFRPAPPEGPPDEGPGERGFRPPLPRDPRALESDLVRSIRGLTAQGSFYVALWQTERGLLAQSPGAPKGIPPPSEAAGEGLRESGPRRGPFGPPRPFVGRTRGDLREVCIPLPGGLVAVVGRSIEDDRALMRRMGLWMLAVGVGIFLLGLAGGGWVAARAIRPIQVISTTAQKISAGDLSQRIDVADTESELGQLAGVLNTTFARLDASFAQQARFTADASHELRTPVTVILTQAQACLTRERSPEEYRETLEACERAAQRMRRLTQSLLELARLDAGEEPMRRERFDLGRVARESVELIAPLAGQRGIALETDLALAECLGDAEHIGRVVTNLLSNAIHYNCAGGTVTVAVRMEGDSGLLQVTDTGAGMSEEDQHHVFERFYRVDKSRARAEGRTGLGLAISKAIVDAHDGSIRVESTPGQGSTFSVRLPLARS